MKRFALQNLINWKNKKNRKPLLIHGARQVGKTWLMNEFGKSNYRSVVYINFERNQRMRDLFNGDLDPSRLITGLEIESGNKIIPEETLLIFDEIQDCKKAITSLKYFYEEKPEYHIVSAGSLLGVALHSGVSYPVGKVDTMTLYPLNFCEFLNALGNEKLSELIFKNDYKLISVFKDKLTELLKQYMYIGGMPEVVANFASNQDFKEVRAVQKQILDDYKRDFSKHVPDNILPKLMLVWDSIPAQLAKENKKFVYNQVQENSRAKDFENAIMWLKDSGLIYKVHRITKPALPIKSYFEENIFKMFLLDVGLLSAMTSLDVKVLLEGDKVFSEFKGAITEQFVLQELSSLSDIEISYWGNDTGIAEVDFVIQKDSHIIPIEVKATTNLKAKSLKVYMEKYTPEYAVRTSLADYKKTDILLDIPLFMIEEVCSISDCK